MNHGRGFNFLQAVEQNIAQSGRMVQFVFDPNGVEPSFAYTIGNFLAGLPEVAMSGLRPEMMGYFLNLTSEMMRAGALTMKDGLVTGELAEGLDTTFRKVTEQTHDAYFGKLVEYSEYRQQPVPGGVSASHPGQAEPLPVERRLRPESHRCPVRVVPQSALMQLI